MSTATAFMRPAARILPSGERRPWTDASATLPDFVPPIDTRPVVAQQDSGGLKSKKSFPFPVWSGLLTVKHRRALGISVWFFLWLLDKVTFEEGGWGIVLGGKPVKDREVAKDLGVHVNTVHFDREALLTGKYIECRRTPYGFTYRVRNSRKFGIWGKERSTRSCDSLQRDPQKLVSPDPQEVVETKKTMQLDRIHPRKKRSDADPRFAQIKDQYFTRTKAIGIEPTFDASDGGQLTRFLEKHPTLTVERISATLSNAFASTDPFPLRPGFRLREFLNHEAKYQLGPLHKTGVNGRSVLNSQPTVEHKLTDKGRRAYAQHGINPESL